MRRDRMAGMAVSVALLACAACSVMRRPSRTNCIRPSPNCCCPPRIAVVIFLAGGVLLASLRLKLISADLGYSLSFRDAVVALSAGQLAGSVFFQLAGQLIGRGMVLSRRGIPASAGLVISGYERFVALGVSLVLAAGGAIYLFGDAQLRPASRRTITGAARLGSDICHRRRRNDRLGPQDHGLPALAHARHAVAARAQHRDLGRHPDHDLAAYVILERQLAPHIGFASLIARLLHRDVRGEPADSMGGWGLRELSAVVALQLIGLSSASALVIALMIGLMSLAVLAVIALAFMIGDVEARGAAIQTPAKTPDYAAALDWLLPLAVATAVFFQIHVPTAGGKLNVNLADPVVLVAAALFVLRHAGSARPGRPGAFRT